MIKVLKGLGIGALFIALWLASLPLAYGASAPEVTITGRTTTTLTLTVDDTTGLGVQDSLVFIFAVEAADSLDGTGYEFATTTTDTSGYTLTGLPERTFGWVIVRADSQGVKAYSARDSVRTLAPQIIDARRPDFSVPVGVGLTDASSYTSVSATTWTINATETDSTGVYFSAPFHSLLATIVGQTDSTNVKIIQMSGFTDEDNDTADLTDDNTFIFAPADTVDITIAGSYNIMLPLSGNNPGNAINEMHYYRIVGQTGNDNSTGTVLTIREIRGE